MSIKFERTRNKYWEKGYIYFLPTIRCHWRYAEDIDAFEDVLVKKELSLIWLTFKVTLEWRS